MRAPLGSAARGPSPCTRFPMTRLLPGLEHASYMESVDRVRFMRSSSFEARPGGPSPRAARNASIIEPPLYEVLDGRGAARCGERSRSCRPGLIARLKLGGRAPAGLPTWLHGFPIPDSSNPSVEAGRHADVPGRPRSGPRGVRAPKPRGGQSAVAQLKPPNRRIGLSGGSTAATLCPPNVT